MNDKASAKAEPSRPETPAPEGSGPADETPDTTPAAEREKEFGGRRDGLDPTRYGDWEKNGRCIDF